ncbi:MAG: EcsC family protein [Micrococcales bacterium]|uniref:EcsC family protein n=1 Tax=Phycicoccus sp. TaxID=1902410 RepID=UPI0019845315|nr:EcsC family protein [Phycicoccus sp.]MBD3782798.1 EcsC family protein [Micrococcales bacterium]HMM96256.1 EcsC family protein [Phycicoccus sp.]
MGLLDRGRRTKDAVQDTRSALERAAESPQDDGVLGRQAVRVVDQILDVGIDGKGPFDSAAKVAEAALRSAGGDREKAVSAVVASHSRLAGAEGFVTGLGGFVTLPVALPANVVAFYALATRMTAAIASLRGHDIAQPQVRAAVLLILAGADADDLLAKAGVSAPVGGLANLAAQRLPGPAAMVVKKGVFFKLVASTGKGVLSRFGRGVPLVGGVVGAGVDVVLLRRLAVDARREFPAVAGRIDPA